VKERGDEGRLVVFLDDLDRCLPDSAVWLLEATKLLLADSEGDAPAVFVFGLDRQIVGEAIRTRYPMSTLYTGENYLEKIFDLSLESPPVKPDVNKLRTFIQEIGGTDTFNAANSALNGTDDSILGVLSDPVFANPRIIKRVINRLYLLTKGRSLPEVTLPHQRAIAWIAGAERFRTFRHFFAEASDDEIVALDSAVGAITKPSDETNKSDALPVRIRVFIDTPGFIRFYRNLLSIEQRSADGVALLEQRKTSEGDQIQTLRDLDNFMRSVGL